jgi:hypothetical protein
VVEDLGFLFLMKAAGKETRGLPTPVRTYGLTHVALAVRDPERSIRICQAILGVVMVYREADPLFRRRLRAAATSWFSSATPGMPASPAASGTSAFG